MNSTERTPTKGFAVLIKAAGAKHLRPREGETITITDKDCKELWSFKNPQGQNNPGVVIYDVQIDPPNRARVRKLLPEALNPQPATPPNTPPSPPTNPS
jgi:hypothetical protein